MPPLPQRATERLHFGRVSAPGAVYFATFVTAGRIPWLRAAAGCDAVLAELRDWHAERDGAVLAASVMPDHVHVLFELGERLDVGRCVSRWKARARKAAGYTGDWQRNFWEHRVRADETWEDYGLYIFLNPYRAKCLPPNDAWPGWWAPDPTRFAFISLLGSRGEPPIEWLDWPESRFEGLSTGE